MPEWLQTLGSVVRLIGTVFSWLSPRIKEMSDDIAGVRTISEIGKIFPEDWGQKKAQEVLSDAEFADHVVTLAKYEAAQNITKIVAISSFYVIQMYAVTKLLKYGYRAASQSFERGLRRDELRERRKS